MTMIFLTLALFIVLFLNFLFLSVLGQQFDSVFWIQVGIGMIPNIASIILALYIVDAFLYVKKRGAFGELNNTSSQHIAYQTNHLLLELLQVLGLEEIEGELDKDGKFTGKLTSIGERIVSDVGLDFVRQEIHKHLEDGSFGTAIMNKASSTDFRGEMQKLESVIKKNLDEVRRYLAQLKPQMSRWVHHLIEEETTDIEATLAIALPMDRDVFGSDKLNLSPEQLTALRSAYLVQMGNSLMRWCIALCNLSMKARQNKLFEVIG